MSLQDLVRSLLSWDSLSGLCKSPYSFLPIVHASHLRIAISLDKNGRHRRATRPGKVKTEEMLNEARPRRRATVDWKGGLSAFKMMAYSLAFCVTFLNHFLLYEFYDGRSTVP